MPAFVQRSIGTLRTFPVINQPDSHPFETEQEIRKLTVLFVVDALSEPCPTFDGTMVQPDAQAALAYIMGLCTNDPATFHLVTRAAWADHTCNPGKPRWDCIHDAVRNIL